MPNTERNQFVRYHYLCTYYSCKHTFDANCPMVFSTNICQVFSLSQLSEHRSSTSLCFALIPPQFSSSVLIYNHIHNRCVNIDLFIKIKNAKQFNGPYKWISPTGQHYPYNPNSVVYVMLSCTVCSQKIINVLPDTWFIRPTILYWFSRLDIVHFEVVLHLYYYRCRCFKKFWLRQLG